MALVEPPVTHELGAVGETCTACGAPLAPDQRYCLNCGRRRGPTRVDLAHELGLERELEVEAAPVPPAPPPGPRSVSPLGAGAIAGLLLLAVLLGVGIGSIAGDEQPIRVAAPPAPRVVVNNQGAAAPAAGTAQAVAFESDWSGGDGWTIQLQTLPKEGATPEQVAAAKAAAEQRGAEDVGALDSDDHPSLDPGEYVVYSGTYESRRAARRDLRALRRDFPDARVVEVSSSADGGGGDERVDTGDADRADDEQLRENQNAGGDDFVRRSRRLPDETATEGRPPPPVEEDEVRDEGGTVIE
jgi:hypothetical protein